MDYRIFCEQMLKIREEESVLFSKKTALKKEYVESLPFKIGDKVEVKGYGIGWVETIRINDYGSVELTYYPPKKNGEKSRKYRNVWYVKVEDIKLL